MEAFLACLVPIAIFAAGWFSCYFLMVKFRFRLERREDYEPAPSSSRPGRVGQPGWEP